MAALLFPSLPAQAADQDFGLIERGRYLTVVGDCAACHTEPGGKPFAGGKALETPFGTLLGPNITPDRETGIGAWTDQEFENALVKGTGRDGAHLYPGMPYVYMTRTTHDDVLAIRAYLATVEPVRHEVEANQLPWPFSMRLNMRFWNALFFKPEKLTPDKSKTLEWNRGQYLVEGLGHCGACHTPKNALGGDDGGRRFAGGPLQGWFAPAITADSARGLGSWSAEQLVQYLKSGHVATAAASGPMAEAVELSTSRMTDPDLRAIATYLKDPPGGATEPDRPAPLATDDPAMRAGAAIYRDQCAACHAPGGTGVPGLVPALANAPSVRQVKADSILHVVLRGARSVGTDAAPTAPAMPSFGWLLNDAQVAAVATYVRNAWGNAAPAVSASDAAAARKALVRRADD